MIQRSAQDKAVHEAWLRGSIARAEAGPPVKCRWDGHEAPVEPWVTPWYMKDGVKVRYLVGKCVKCRLVKLVVRDDKPWGPGIARAEWDRFRVGTFRLEDRVSAKW